MSLQHNRCVSHLKAVECCIRRPQSLLWAGTPLSRVNTRFMQDIYTIMSAMWFSTLPDPVLHSSRWANQLVGADVMEILDAFKAADRELITNGYSPVSFKRWRRASYPGMGHIFAPIQAMVERIPVESGMRLVRSCLLFITRANFPEPLGLEDEAFEKWRAVALRKVDVVPTLGEKAFVERLFPRRDIPRLREGFKPRFGPGHSSGLVGHSLATKYATFSSDAGLRYIGCKLGFRPDEMPRHRDGLDRCGEFNLVPKQLDRLRSTTMEPAPLMFYQLGVAHYMVETFNKKIIHHIDLEHAERNAELAWEGSLTGEYATIDLSSASDSVTYKHVQALFHDTCLREALAMTRSRQVSYRGQIYEPTYFAPMGSGLCFPVECCVFGSIVDATMRSARDRRAWRVYGDDIVCPTDRYDEIIARLCEAGFTVNEDKSFNAPYPSFRESCGGEYFQGIDVTPIRVSRRFRGFSRRDATAIEGWVDLANRLVHFPAARGRVIEELLRIKPSPIFSDDGETGIFSTHPTNHHLKGRWNADLQTWEYRCGQLKSRPRRSPDEYEDIRLFEWLRAHADRKELDPVASQPTSIVTPGAPYWGAAWCSPSAGWQPEGGKPPGESRRGTGP